MEKIFYFLERIYRMTHIPVLYLDATGSFTLFSLGNDTCCNPLLTDESLCNSIVNRLHNNKLPILEFEEKILYGSLKDSMENIIIFGPVCTLPISDDLLSQYMLQHKIKSETFRILTKSIDELCSALSTLFYAITEIPVKDHDIITNASNNLDNSEGFNNIYENYVFENSEYDLQRYNYTDEVNFQKMIKCGNVHAVKDFENFVLLSFQEDRVGKLAKKSFKQNEYLACTTIILASRAAIEGGLDPLTSFLMSDLYLQILETCKDIPSIYQLMQEVSISYAERVQQLNNSKSQHSYVEQCKNYIAKNLNKQFTIEDLAKVIKIHKNYLNRQFSKEVGMGIQQYTQKKRIEASANMLKFSDASILTISNYLCFSSQSHFGKLFKQYMGETPKMYRDKNKLLDFSNRV
ncbi:AraC family transcriptional regulator [Paenibacillus segetis]|uniref:HTH araC/xylS-type domain-containing protein n=1 Tax=Paenibacillus segetis TaxID=1325360 RepID=A0ABQ1YSX2_9BACL|nr:AraC family transcriptional regulator [Paenibacillus segetis]GGH35269.1 hypothetical protein GCM10008013_41490 [Paenibacillus segetis]